MKDRWPGAVLVIAVLVVWEIVIATGMIETVSLPRVSDIFVAWGQLIADGSMIEVVGSTLRRMFIGFAIATILAIPVGLVMGSSRWAHSLLEPITELVRPIPSPAYIPIAILLLGIGDPMKIAVVVTASVFPILLNTYQGVINLDRTLINTGRTLGASKTYITRRIALPAALPSILTGMRVSLGVSFIVVVVAEMIAGGSGLGHFILNSQRSFHVAEMYAGIFTLAVLGYAFNRLFILGEGWALRSRDRSLVRT
ncbi:MAG: ABC transporter permease [Acidimicrobiia bacterium]